eukprot:1159135-Pelagomonas_calceolata.AAC.7
MKVQPLPASIVALAPPTPAHNLSVGAYHFNAVLTGQNTLGLRPRGLCPKEAMVTHPRSQECGKLEKGMQAIAGKCGLETLIRQPWQGATAPAMQTAVAHLWVENACVPTRLHVLLLSTPCMVPCLCAVRKRPPSQRVLCGSGQATASTRQACTLAAMASSPSMWGAAAHTHPLPGATWDPQQQRARLWMQTLAHGRSPACTGSQSGQ